METQFISLNMTPTGVNPCFHISQYDVGRMLGFIVHSGGATVDLDTYTCTIEATRSDGTAITSAVATTDNIGTFEVTPTMSNKADKYRCQLIIVDENSKRIASLPFDMEVTKAAMDENSEAIEEDASLYQQYTEAVQGAIAEANADIQAEENARIAAVNAEATARANAITAEATARQTADNTLQGNINSEASTRASADSNLQSQINQIITPSGEAPSAAEVQNARIGYDNSVYNTVGNAIRSQINDLKDANSINIVSNALLKNKNANGVKWTMNDDHSVTAIGTATGTTATFDFFNDASNFPNGLEAGKKVYVEYNSKNIDFRVYICFNNTTDNMKGIDYFNSDGYFVIPNNATGILFRLAVPKGRSVNDTVLVKMWSEDTNAIIAENLKKLFNDVNHRISITWFMGSFSANGEKDIPTSPDNYMGTSYIIKNAKYAFVTRNVRVHVLLLYRNGVYIGKIASDGSVNKIAGDWKHFYEYDVLNLEDIYKQYEVDGIKFAIKDNTGRNFTDVQTEGDFNCQVYMGAEHDDDIYKMSECLPSVLPNNILDCYPRFRFSTIDTSNNKIEYGAFNTIRCSAIVQFDKPTYLRLVNPDYSFGIYWYDNNNVLHSKKWDTMWEVPSGVPVGISIRRHENSSNPESMDGETPWLYLVPSNEYDEPKSYFKSEIESVAKRVKQANTEPALCFLLSTDQHYMTTINWLLKYDSISDMTANMKAVGEAINFDFNVSLGDIADFKPPYSDAVAARFGILDRSAANLDSVFAHWRDYAMTRLKNVNPNFIYACGNHDDNRYLRVDTKVSGYDYTPGEMYSYYMSNAYKTLTGSNPDNLLEYYFDIDRLGIRVIVLDSNYYNGTGWDYGFSDSTADWLGGVLASSSGKQVLILSHMSPVASHNGDNYAYHNFDAVANVIQTWKTGGGDLIALMYGHSHCDWSATSPWLDITFCCQKIHQLSSSEPYANMPGSVAPARTFGTATEDCWNVVIIKPKSRKINIIRFGAGVDREFTY